MESIKLINQEGSLVLSGHKITVGFGLLSVIGPKGNINSYKEFLTINGFDLNYKGLDFTGPYYLTKFSRDELNFASGGRYKPNDTI